MRSRKPRTCCAVPSCASSRDDEQADEIEQSYARLLDDLRRPRSIYGQVRDIINQRYTGHQLSTYLDDPLGTTSKICLAEVVGECKPIHSTLTHWTRSSATPRCTG